MGCCSSKPEPMSKKKKRAKRFRSLRMSSKSPGKRTNTDSEADIKSDVSDIFDKYDFGGQGVLSERQIRYMIMQMASTRRSNSTRKDIEKYVQTFMRNFETENPGQITRQEFYRYYKTKDKKL